VRAQIGPMARTVGDLELAWKSISISEQAEGDPRVPPLSAADPKEVSLDGLRIGLYDGDDLIEPAAVMRRAVHRAAEVLAEAGATVIDYTPASSADVVYMWMAGITSDGGATLGQRLAGEATSPQLKPSRAIARVPGPARRLASVALGQLGQERLARLLEVLGRKPVEELWQLTHERTVLRQREHDGWHRAGIHALVCPAHVAPAMHHRASSDFTLSIGPLARWSLLNFPAGTVPVTKVRPGEQSYQGSHGDRLDDKMRSILDGSAGLPIGVQVVALPFREQVALAVMRAIETGVFSDEDRPRSPIDPVR
ncbi:MAG: amidase, partial [Deltaproteobacteria bacterium]|nr:amidase [Deltaproteobacteria bacterium]